MQLGRDEQKQTAPFVNLVNPTALDQVTKSMYDLIREYYHWDWVNVKLQYRIGGGPLYFGEAGEPIREFLRRLIHEMKRLKKPLNQNTIEAYKQVMQTKYDYSDAALKDYFQAYIELDQAEGVPEEIAEPWTYTPTTLFEDIENKTFSKLGLYVLAGVAVWGISTTIIPQTTKAVRN